MGRIDEADRRALLETGAMSLEHAEVRTTLEMLRKTRKARGGVGAPLVVPGHLRDAAAGVGIVVTDADLSPSNVKSREEENDLDSDRAAEINKSEAEEE